MELLTGSGEGREVWRAGDTVRRAVGPQTPAVHALLRHLEAVGFEGAPRVLGFDEQGREVLTYVEGEPGWHGPYDDRTLAETARTIRRFLPVDQHPIELPRRPEIDREPAIHRRPRSSPTVSSGRRRRPSTTP